MRFPKRINDFICHLAGSCFGGSLCAFVAFTIVLYIEPRKRPRASELYALPTAPLQMSEIKFDRDTDRGWDEVDHS